MTSSIAFFRFLSAAILCLLAGLAPGLAPAQSSSSSSSSQSSSSGQMYAREKAPSLIDPAGPTISLISSEPVFVMAAALNACGYDEGLEESAPVRKHVRDEMNQALAQSEDARAKRDALCLYIAQHRMTGTERDISQYISLALYLTPPPELEVTADLTEMPPDSTQVVEIVPLLRAFAAAVDLHGIWLAVAPRLRRGDRQAARSAVADDRHHQSLPQDAGLHLRRPQVHRGHRAAAFAGHGQCAHLRHRLRGGGFAGQRQDSHERRAPHLPALRHRSAALTRGPTPSTASSRFSRRFATRRSISATAPIPCR